MLMAGNKGGTRHYPAISVADMVEVDRLMVHVYGIALVQMMENAGRSLATLGRHLLGGDAAGRKVVVLAGKGNNGGGGLAAARHLANAGAEVSVALAAAPMELGEAPEVQLGALVHMGIKGTDLPFAAAQLKQILGDADLIVDALIGYSLRGAPREPIASFIRAANAASVPILSLDIPSGLNGDTGLPSKPTVGARATLTLAWPKIGLLSSTAQPFVGHTYLSDIGVPASVYRAVGVDPGAIFSRGPVVEVRRVGNGWEPASVLEGNSAS